MPGTRVPASSKISKGSASTKSTAPTSSSAKDSSDEDSIDYTARLVAKRQTHFTCCGKPLTYLNFFFVIALGGMIYEQKFMQFYDLGSPPTHLGHSVAGRIPRVAGTAAAMEIVGFIVLNANITSLVLAMTYLFVVTIGLYDSIFIVSRSWYSRGVDDFNELVEYGAFYYKRSNNLPDFIDKYQRRHGCCGWGKRNWMKWARELNSTDLPDSCCSSYSKGCGKGILPRHPTGFIQNIPTTSEQEYNAIKKRMDEKYGIAKRESKLKVIHQYWWGQDGPAGTVLDKEANLPNPEEPISPYYLRFIDEEFIDDYEAEKKAIVLLVAKNESTSLVYYHSKGLEESGRIKGFVHSKSCESTKVKYPDYILPDTRRGVNKKVDIKMLEEVKKVMLPFLGYGCLLILVHFLMLLIFYNYFQKIKATQLAVGAVPVDFQETDVRSTSFMTDASQYLPTDVIETIRDFDNHRRDVQDKIREALDTRYKEIVELHKHGINFKPRKIRQPSPNSGIPHESGSSSDEPFAVAYHAAAHAARAAHAAAALKAKNASSTKTSSKKGKDSKHSKVSSKVHPKESKH